MTDIELPEAHHFMDAASSVEHDALTACRGWRVHEVVAHLAAGAAEVGRNLRSFASGGPESVPATRTLGEREAPFRSMRQTELRASLTDALSEQIDLVASILRHDPTATTPWTGRQMPVADFITHARSELAIHRWDIVGDDEISSQLLADPTLTDHAVNALGAVLAPQNTELGETTIALETPGHPSVLVAAGGLTFTTQSDTSTVRVIAATPADRLLFLWGRTPIRPGAIRVLGDSEAAVIVRGVLPGY